MVDSRTVCAAEGGYARAEAGKNAVDLADGGEHAALLQDALLRGRERGRLLRGAGVEALGLAARELDDLQVLLPELEEGLTDIEGFSHLFVIWVFDRSDRVELIGIAKNEVRQDQQEMREDRKELREDRRETREDVRDRAMHR